MFTGVTNKRGKVVDYMKSGDRTNADDNATRNCVDTMSAAAVKRASATTVQFLPHSSINIIPFSLPHIASRSLSASVPRPLAQDDCERIEDIPALTARHSMFLSPTRFPLLTIGARQLALAARARHKYTPLIQSLVSSHSY